MNRLLPYGRLLLFVALAVWLGYVVQADPQRVTLSLPDKGVTVSVPKNLEGWVLEPGEGDVLIKGKSSGGLVTLEIAHVPVHQNGDIYGFIQDRHKRVKAGKEEYIVWHQGMDSKFGLRPAPTYKATYQGPILRGLSKTEIWQYDSYWPYKGQYARISMTYPNFMVQYVHMDKMIIAASLKLAR